MESAPGVFRLERGVTGFGHRNDPPLPSTDARTCRTAWYAAARAAPDGQVHDFVEVRYPQTFHSATISDRNGLHVALFHAHHPLIAFVGDQVSCYTDEFQDPPPWASVLTDLGFAVLSARQLLSPLTDADTSALSSAEWREITYWRPETLGATLFNSWD
ncbi:hypothetical protein [Streptomyces sp. CO7]